MLFYKLSLKTSKNVEFVDITDEVKNVVQKSGIKEGVCTVFIPHTTAAVTINEAADPAVRVDIINEINKLVPFNDNYKHLEGNSSAHIKSSLFGTSTQVPITDGNLALGTWQGIYFCEFDGPRNRSFFIQFLGSRQ